MAKYLPGQSGNPKGRPKRAVEEARASILKDIFDEKAERAVIQNMLRIAQLKGLTTNGVAINAATWLWDRAYGKPKEYLELDANVDVKGYMGVTPDDWDADTTDQAPDSDV